MSGVMAVPLHPWSSWIDISFFPPWFGMNWTWTKTKFFVVAHLRCPVDNWTVRKCSKKIFHDGGGFCRVLKEQITIIIITFKVRGKSSWFWRFVSGRVSKYWIAAITADKWASLLYSSNCLAKKHISLCQACVRQSRYGCWLSGSSKCWSSNVYAALGSGSAMRSMVNKRAPASWWWAFGLTEEAA